MSKQPEANYLSSNNACDSTKIEFEVSRKCTVNCNFWSCYVLASAFLIRIVCGGLLVTFGLFIDPLVAEFQTPRSVMGWMASFLSAMNLLSAPLATVLSLWLSNRSVVMIGAIFAAVVFSAPYLYSPLWMLFLSTILTGTGMGVATMATTVVLTKYFENNLSIVLGIFTSGTGFASFLITPLFEKIIKIYGWRLAMLIYGSLFAACALFALAFREISKEDQNKETIPDEKPKHCEKNLSKSQLNVFQSAINILAQNDEDGKKRYCTSLQHLSDKDRERKMSDNRVILSQLSIPTLYGMSMKDNLDNTPKENDEEEGAVDEEKEQPKENNLLSLLKNWVFILFLISNFLTNLGHDTPFIYVKPRVMNMGVPESDAVALLMYIGIGNTIGRLFFGWLVSLKSVKAYIINCASLIICGTALIASSQAITYPMMIAYNVIFGTFIGSYTALAGVVVVEIIGIKLIDKGLGITYILQALGLLICSPLSGLIFDLTKNFDWSFNVSGYMILASGILMLFPFASKKFRESQRNI